MCYELRRRRNTTLYLSSKIEKYNKNECAKCRINVQTVPHSRSVVLSTWTSQCAKTITVPWLLKLSSVNIFFFFFWLTRLLFHASTISACSYIYKTISRRSGCYLRKKALFLEWKVLLITVFCGFEQVT